MNSNLVYLVQTDTTVGFLSQNYKKLNKIKNRPENKKILIEVESLKILKNFVRVPGKFKKKIRRSNKITYIYPNGNSFRIIKNKNHLEFLKKFKWMYSTSANESGKKFDENWARQKADIIVEEKNGFFENSPSIIYKISKSRVKRIR